MRLLVSADLPCVAHAARVPRFAAAALAVGLLVPALAAAGQPAEDDTLEWIDDYATALAQAQETGRPLLVEFRCAP